MSGWVSLIRATAGHCAQLLNLDSLNHILELNVLLLKLEVLAFHSLQISHPTLKLLIQVTNALVIVLLHFSHFLLHALYHELLLLIVAGSGPLIHAHTTVRRVRTRGIAAIDWSGPTA